MRFRRPLVGAIGGEVLARALTISQPALPHNQASPTDIDGFGRCGAIRDMPHEGRPYIVTAEHL